MASDRIGPALFFYVGRAQQKQKAEKKHKICRVAQNLRQKNGKSDKKEWNRCFVLNVSCFLLALQRYSGYNKGIKQEMIVTVFYGMDMDMI